MVLCGLAEWCCLVWTDLFWLICDTLTEAYIRFFLPISLPDTLAISDWESLQENEWGLGYLRFLVRYDLLIESLCFLLRYLLDRTLFWAPLGTVDRVETTQTLGVDVR